MSRPAGGSGALPHARGSGWVEGIVRLTSPERIRSYTRLMLAITLGGGAVQAALGPGLLDSFGHVVGGDFLAFFTGARLYLDGRAADLYDLGAQRAFQVELTSPHVLRGIHPFVNPPFAVALYLPYALWGYPIGLALWWGTGLASLAGAAALLRGELATLARYSTAQLWGAAFLFFPTVAWILYGQVTPLVLLLYAATFVLLRRGSDFAAGAMLGALAFKPQLALTVAAVLLLKWRWRALLGGMVTASAWIAAGLWLTPDPMTQYLRVSPAILALLRWEEYPRWGLHSLMGFWSLLLDGSSPRAAGALALLSSAATLGLVAWHWVGRTWNPGSAGWDLAMAATLALGLIISPHLFVYDLMLLLLPFAIVFHHFPVRGDAILDRGPLLAWSVLVWGAAFLSSYAALAQLRLTEWLGLPAAAVQASTVVLFMWGRTVFRMGHVPVPDKAS